MDREKITSSLGIVFAAGSAWGLVEFGAGLGLQKCATLVTGAILTGLSFFWMSMIWTVTRRLFPLLIIVGIAILFKWLDALMLQVAWNHGSVLNPMFAFITALIGFGLLISFSGKRFTKNLRSRILVGGGAALIATGMFPLVGLVTGNPACTYAATNIPLTIFTSPVAILIAMVTVPMGYRAAQWLNRRDSQARPVHMIYRLWSPAFFIACAGIIIMVRLI